MKQKTKAIIYVLICVFLWALIPVVSKTGQTDLDNHQFLFWSSVVSLITFLILLLTQRKIPDLTRLSRKNWGYSVILGLLGTYLYYILLYFGYANTHGIEVLIIQYCWPIFVILLSIIILKEKVNGRKIISVIFGFLGVSLVLTKGNFTALHFDNFFVDVIVLLAAFIFGLFSVLSKKVNIDSFILVSIYFLTASVASLISMISLSEFKLPTGNTIMPILINGIFVNGISYIFWIKALRQGNASFVAPFVFLTPAISTVFLVLFFKEPFQAVYIMGMILVISGGIINRK